jgi:pimeloyl-ACP methyl ester carboxylesterase
VCVLLATSVYGAETAIASRIATVDGLNQHYLTAGHGPTVILLHGYTQTSRMWRPIIPLVLKDTGHWVLEEKPNETTDALIDFLEKNKGVPVVRDQIRET